MGMVSLDHEWHELTRMGSGTELTQAEGSVGAAVWRWFGGLLFRSH